MAWEALARLLFRVVFAPARSHLVRWRTSVARRSSDDARMRHAITLVAALLIAACTERSPQPPTTGVSESAQPVETPPAAIVLPPPREPAARVQAPTPVPQVYRWRDANDQLHLSDQRPPEGTLVDVISTPPIRPAAPSGGGTASASTNARAVTIQQPRATQPREVTLHVPTSVTECRRIIQTSLDRVAARMRAGYRSQEGERLRARQRELNAARYACSRNSEAWRTVALY